MKRTSSIDLSLLRKSVGKFKLKPLYLGLAAATLMSCSSREEAVIVNSVEECRQSTDFTQQECEAAYQKARAEAERTAPRYRSRRDCEYEFGVQNCVGHSSGYFMPAMAGFIIGQVLSSQRNYNAYNPVFATSGYGSYRDRLITSDGNVIGRPGQRTTSVRSSDLRAKPMPTRTISRGGFGSTASAKSSWGGSRGGWGG